MKRSYLDIHAAATAAQLIVDMKLDELYDALTIEELEMLWRTLGMDATTIRKNPKGEWTGRNYYCMGRVPGSVISDRMAHLVAADLMIANTAGSDEQYYHATPKGIRIARLKFPRR